MTQEQNGEQSEMTQVSQAMNQRKARRQLGKQSREVSEKTKETVLKAALEIFAREGFNDFQLNSHRPEGRHGE